MEIPTVFHVNNTDNQIVLEGLLSVPASATAGAVICHPHPLYGGEMHNNVVTALIEAFHECGMATLRFNFRGVGKNQQGLIRLGCLECAAPRRSHPKTSTPWRARK